MSAIASFVMLPLAALDDLRQIAKPTKKLLGKPKDEYWVFLRQKGRVVAEYGWSGYVLGTVLCWLRDEHHVDLMDSPHNELANFLTKARGSSHSIFTNDHKLRFLKRLDPSRLSVETLRDYYNKFNGTNEPDAGTPMVDGVAAIRESLEAVDDKSVVLLIIG